MLFLSVSFQYEKQIDANLRTKQKKIFFVYFSTKFVFLNK
jgi:hypothetical protein